MRKTLTFVAIGVVAAVATLAVYRASPPFFRNVDLRLKDARFAFRGARPAGDKVVVVAIDNRSVKEIGRWPWPRDVFGKLLSGIARSGAKVIALDVVFSEPQGEAPDAALGRAVGEAGNVVLGFFFRDEEQAGDAAKAAQVASSRVKLLKLDAGVTSIPIPEYRSYDANVPRVGERALDFGFFNVLHDPDGLYRKSALLILNEGVVYPSLPLKALRHYTGGEILVDVAPFGVRSVSVGPLAIPADESGMLSLNFYGPAGAIRSVSAADVAAGRLPADAFRDRIVFVGATETGIGDIRATPFDPVLPGVEIHATMASNALGGQFLLRDGRTLALEMAFILALPVALALFLASVSRTVSGLGGFAAALLLQLAVNQALFARWNVDMSIVYPILSVGAAYVGCEAYRNLVVERKGRYLRKAFSSYVSPALVEEITRNPDRLTLGGEKRDISILFSDIRGFTSVSEKLSPEELVFLLNHYLSPMTRIVLEEKGTLDKYIGDAIMAIYNAPLDVPDHPARACASALRMIGRLEGLNREFAAKGMTTLAIGIGINTGDAVVGNMGADMRFDYTAIGDAVNLASRLEGQNKVYGTCVIVSESTRVRAGDGFHFREIDKVRVKGKKQPVPIHELWAERPAWADRYEAGLAEYRAMRFPEAQAQFRAIALEHGDPVSRLYVDRCAAFLAHPPPEGWDGICEAATK